MKKKYLFVSLLLSLTSCNSGIIVYENHSITIIENDDGTITPLINIYNKYGEDVSTEYKIGLVVKNKEVEIINLKVDTVKSTY